MTNQEILDITMALAQMFLGFALVGLMLIFAGTGGF